MTYPIIYIKAENSEQGLKAVVDNKNKITCSYEKNTFSLCFALHVYDDVKKRALRYHTHKGL